MKKIWVGLLVIGIIVFSLIFLFSFIFGFPIGQECGNWSAFGGIQKECKCVGIKTGGCPPGALCDSGTYGCIGICQNCICRNVSSEKREIIPCD